MTAAGGLSPSDTYHVSFLTTKVIPLGVSGALRRVHAWQIGGQTSKPSITAPLPACLSLEVPAPWRQQLHLVRLGPSPSDGDSGQLGWELTGYECSSSSPLSSYLKVVRMEAMRRLCQGDGRICDGN